MPFQDAVLFCLSILIYHYFSSAIMFIYCGSLVNGQANLYVAEECIIGGDIIATGQGGFQGGLAFPETETT